MSPKSGCASAPTVRILGVYTERGCVDAVSEAELLSELARLEREERRLSARRHLLHERIASFPTPQHERAEQELSRQRRGLHRQIDAVHAEIESIRAELPAPLLRDSELGLQS